MTCPHSMIDCRDKDGNSLLMLAVMNGNLHLVNYLLEKGGNINSQNVIFRFILWL